MTDFGVTPTGFVLKRLEDILKSIQDRHRVSFGDEIDSAIATELGQLDGNFASELAEIWELAQEAFNGFDIENAADYLLTALASLVGTARPAAKATTVVGTVNLNAGSSAPAGSIVYISGRPDLQFTLDATYTNSGGSPADIPANATATQTGPIVAASGTTWVIQTPASGWNNFQNATHDAVPGRNVANDIELRQLMIDERAIRGGSTLRAIMADLRNTTDHPELANIRSVDGLENDGDVVNADALPPHSIELIIDDGDSPPTTSTTAIAQTIWDSKGGGVQTTGTFSATATDANGDPQTVKYSYVATRPVYLSYTLNKTSDYPSDGDTQVKDAILAYATQIKAGQNVVALAFEAIPLSIKGVLDVTSFHLGFAPSPSGTTNLTIGRRERATFAGANITIT